MTIALGILASDGIAIAADTQETDGYFKSFALKIHCAMTQTSTHSTVKSAVAVTGSGSGVYLDVIAAEIIGRFHSHQDSDIATFEGHLKECVEEFHAKHVTPLPPHLAREVSLIVGAQIENRNALWATDVSTVKRSLGFEATGSGHPYARMAIQNRALHMDAQSAAVLAVLGVMRAKDYDQNCGKSTTVVFLKGNLAYTVPPYLVEEAEGLFAQYVGIEYGALFYALGMPNANEANRPRKLSQSLRKLRKQFSSLAAQLLEHKP
jgi:20S proteasome alpha/beta subunit